MVNPSLPGGAMPTSATNTIYACLGDSTSTMFLESFQARATYLCLVSIDWNFRLAGPGYRWTPYFVWLPRAATSPLLFVN